jgi:RimJ/RimL family protein N-acetyltransferase
MPFIGYTERVAARGREGEEHVLPSFQTSRLTLRQRTTADIEACLAMDRDPEVTRFIVGPWTDPVAHRAFVEARIRAAYPTGMGYWSVFASDRFVGWILLTPLGVTDYPPVDLPDPDTEIGWRFVRAAWGRGYATEAARPVLDHALTTLLLPQVVADIDPANTASVGVARKLGFRMLGPIEHAGRIVIRYVAGAAGPPPQ